MYGSKILCEISKGTFEISHKILNPYTAKYAFYSHLCLPASYKIFESWQKLQYMLTYNPMNCHGIYIHNIQSVARFINSKCNLWHTVYIYLTCYIYIYIAVLWKGRSRVALAVSCLGTIFLLLVEFPLFSEVPPTPHPMLFACITPTSGSHASTTFQFIQCTHDLSLLASIFHPKLSKMLHTSLVRARYGVSFVSYGFWW